MTIDTNTHPKLPEGLRKLTAEEKLEIVYQFKLSLLQGLVEANPALAYHPDEINAVNGD